jgi:hypothetical protein
MRFGEGVWHRHNKRWRARTSLPWS